MSLAWLLVLEEGLFALIREHSLTVCSLLSPLTVSVAPSTRSSLAAPRALPFFASRLKILPDFLPFRFLPSLPLSLSSLDPTSSCPTLTRRPRLLRTAHARRTSILVFPSTSPIPLRSIPPRWESLETHATSVPLRARSALSTARRESSSLDASVSR